MSFIHLACTVHFDCTHQEGQLLDLGTGMGVYLDPLATLFLQTALESETFVEAINALQNQVEATPEQLQEALTSVLDHLLTHGFLSPTAASERRCKKAWKRPEAHSEVPEASPPCSRLDRYDSVTWEFFLTGRIMNDPLPQISRMRRGKAFWHTGMVLLLVGSTQVLTMCCDALHRPTQAQWVRQWSWKRLCWTLSRQRISERSFQGEQAARIARRELVWCQMLVRLLAPTAVCLVRSLALCAYLRALQMPATVVIGRACFDLSGAIAFHAWVELAGHVVNDHAEMQSGYTVLLRIPSPANGPFPLP